MHTEDLNAMLQHWKAREAAGEVPFRFKKVDKAARRRRGAFATAAIKPIGQPEGPRDNRDTQGDGIGSAAGNQTSVSSSGSMIVYTDFHVDPHQVLPQSRPQPRPVFGNPSPDSSTHEAIQQQTVPQVDDGSDGDAAGDQASVSRHPTRKQIADADFHVDTLQSLPQPRPQPRPVFGNPPPGSSTHEAPEREATPQGDYGSDGDAAGDQTRVRPASEAYGRC